MFIPQSNHVLQLTVDARVDGQQVLNVFHYKHSSPDTGPTGGSSATFLTNFRTIFRTLIDARLYPAYAIQRYWLRSIYDVAFVNPPAPGSYRPVYHPDMLDFLDGVPGDNNDQGGLAEPAGYLPTYVCLRTLKNPEHRRVGYLSRNYNRFGPFARADLDADPADHDLWSTDLVTAWTTAINTFADAAVLDQVAGNGWDMAVFSAQYHGKVGKPLGASITKAAEKVTSVTVMQYAGTQVSRRYRPRGGFQGS